MWFVKIDSILSAEYEMKDDYNHTAFKGERFVKGHYHGETSKEKRYRQVKQSVFVRPESVVYPFVSHEYKDHNNICTIQNTDYVEVLHYIAESGSGTI